MKKQKVEIAKPWFKSTTLWLNAIGVAVMALQMLSSTNLVVDKDWQVIILALLNILNRFKTSVPVKI